MQDIEYLKSRGATTEKLRKKLTHPIKDPKIKELIQIHEQRLTSAIRKNMKDSRHWWTIDKIVDAGMRNLCYVQARELLCNKTFLENDKIVEMFQSWGLNQMLTPVVRPDGKPVLDKLNKPILEINVPLFDTVFVPLVGAYRTMRWSKLYNERANYPLYNYSPSQASTKHLVQTELITSVIARMSSDMGYSNDLKQCILSMLDYGIALRMPDAAWFRQEYDTKVNGKVVTKTQREGVRFVMPRPERTFYDMSFPVTSINTDTGCSYYGYWDMVRYGTIKRNRDFWNVDCVNYGASSLLFQSPEWAYMGELYPCTLKLPTCPDNCDGRSVDRLDEQFWYGTSSQEDAACPLTVMFDKLVPSEWNLFDYDKEVWTRWVYADTGTVVYMEVLPYSPGAAYLYDYDSNRALQNSLTIQLSPFQQMFGNFLTQHYITVRNNLPRIVFYNTDIVPKEQVERMKAQKSRMYQELTFLPFSKREQSYQQQTLQDAFFPLTMPQSNTNELASTLRLTIEVLERMLGFPSQEVGQPASHEQTAREVIVVSENSNSRSLFTGDGIDSAEKAVKRILYEAWVQYGSDDVTATVVGASEEKLKLLEEMGFKVEKGEGNKENTYGVQGKKGALVLDVFATDQTGNTRSQDPKVAIAMMQALSVALQNPVLFQALGVEQVVQLINDVFIWAGLPDDFRLKVAKDYKSPDDQRQEFVDQLEKAKGEILKAAIDAQQKQLLGVADGIKKQVIEPMKATFGQVGQRLQAQETNDQQRDQILAQVMQALGRLHGVMGNGGPPPPPGMEVPPPVPLPMGRPPMPMPEAPPEVLPPMPVG